MDAKGFDELSRTVSFWSSRRHLFARLAVTFAPLLPLALGRDAAAKKRHKKHGKKHKKRKPACSPPCTGAKVCQGGTCVCPHGTEECGGECRNLCGGEFRARNPFTCDCCITHTGICHFADEECCGGSCSDPICIGLAAGQECTFDAQCISGNCNGFCGN